MRDFCENDKIFWFHKMQEISFLREESPAFQGLSYIHLVIIQAFWDINMVSNKLNVLLTVDRNIPLQ